jgi:PTH1 family peptidyl-tRNA hydrolase
MEYKVLSMKGNRTPSILNTPYCILYTDMKLIIGLGNPGKKYRGTRHNLGFIAVDAFAKQEGGVWKKDEKRKAETCQVTVGEEKVILAKPTTFMNLSGEAATALLSFYKVSIENLLIVHDELDLAPGRIQLKPAGSRAAGHNGVASIQERLSTKEIPRLRLGIGRPEPDQEPIESYVLGPLSTEHPPNVLDITSKMRDWIEGRV